MPNFDLKVKIFTGAEQLGKDHESFGRELRTKIFKDYKNIGEVEVSHGTTDPLLTRYGISLFPCILYIKKNSLVKAIVGKFDQKYYTQFLDDLGW